jgi:hypothetical protein
MLKRSTTELEVPAYLLRKSLKMQHDRDVRNAPLLSVKGSLKVPKVPAPYALKSEWSKRLLPKVVEHF